MSYNPEHENEQADRNPLYKGAIIFLIVIVLILLFLIFFAKKPSIELEPLLAKQNDSTVLFNKFQEV